MKENRTIKKNRILVNWSIPLLLFSLFTVQSMAKEKFYIPTNIQPQAPLFVAIHGCLSNSEEMESSTRLSEFAEAYGFYVFYPEPSNTQAKGCFEFYTEDSQKPGGGDSAIIVSKVQEYIKKYDIDPERVFIAGMSAGASIVPTLINCYPTLFRGAAMHSGMGYGLITNWQEALWVAQKGPIKNKERLTYCSSSEYKGKVFLIQGTEDKIMNPKNHKLLNKDYFSGLSFKTEKVKRKKDVYGYKRKYYYHDNKLVGQSLLVKGMGHDWSGGPPRFPLTSLYGPDVTPMIVDFFLSNE